jgi:Fe-S oxidoreductase
VRIALFITCVTDTLFPKAGQATVRVLERLGHTVVFPEEQARRFTATPAMSTRHSHW